MGDLFYHGTQPTEIERMRFSSMSFWSSWVDTIRRQGRKKPEDKSRTFFRSIAQDVIRRIRGQHA